MKQLILGICFLVCGFVCVGQNDTINQKVKGKKEGYWIKHRANGQIKWEGYYVKGEKTGYWKIYNKEGTHYSEGKLINGERIGDWYYVHAKSGTKLDKTVWDGKGNCVGGATLSW